MTVIVKTFHFISFFSQEIRRGAVSLLGETIVPVNPWGPVSHLYTFLPDSRDFLPALADSCVDSNVRIIAVASPHTWNEFTKDMIASGLLPYEEGFDDDEDGDEGDNDNGDEDAAAASVHKITGNMTAGGAVHIYVIPITEDVLSRLRKIRESNKEEQQQREAQTQQKMQTRRSEKLLQLELQQERLGQLEQLEQLEQSRVGENNKDVVCIKGSTLGERIQTLIDDPTLQQQWNKDFFERWTSATTRSASKLMNKLYWRINRRYIPFESDTGGGGLTRAQSYQNVRLHCKLG